MRKRKPKHGFTMVEVLTASAVVAVALVASAGAVLQSAHLQRINGQVRAAAPILASLLEEVRATPYSSVQTTFGGVTRSVTGMSDVSQAAQATFTVNELTTLSTRWTLRQVKVKLTWTGPSGPMELSAVTYVSDRPGETDPPGGALTNGNGN